MNRNAFILLAIATLFVNAFPTNCHADGEGGSTTTQAAVPDIGGWWFRMEATLTNHKRDVIGRAIVRHHIIRLDEISYAADLECQSANGSSDGPEKQLIGARVDLKWNPHAREFSGWTSWPLLADIKEPGKANYILKLGENGQSISCEIRLDDTATAILESLKTDGILKGVSEKRINQLFHQEWRRIDPREPIEGQDLMVTETETGLAAFSKSLGTWANVEANFTDDGRTRCEHITLGTTFALATFSDELLGYCSKAGRWGRLPIPKEARGQVFTTVGLNSLVARIGSRTFVFSATTGEWTSPDSQTQPTKDSTSTKDSTRTTATSVVGLDDAESNTSLGNQTNELSAKIALHESDATAAAQRIKNLPTEIGKGHPTAVEAKLELDRELGAALDLRFQREELQVKELRNRIARLERQITERKALRKDIIERRAAEMIDGDLERLKDSNETAPADASSDAQPSNTVVDSGDSIKERSYRADEIRRLRGLRGRSGSVRSASEKLDAHSAGSIADELLTELKNARDAVESRKSTIRKLEERVQSSKSPKNSRDLNFAQGMLTKEALKEKTVIEQIRAAILVLELQKNEAELQSQRQALGVDSKKETNSTAEKLPSPEQSKISKLDESIRLLREMIGNSLRDSIPRELDAIRNSPTVLLDVDFRAAFLGELFGCQFEIPVSRDKNDSLKRTRYTQGLPIVKIRENGHAGNLGLRKGDILVGIDKWETKSIDDVLWIVDQLKERPGTGDSNQIQANLTIVRDGTERVGEITFDPSQQRKVLPIQEENALSPGF